MTKGLGLCSEKYVLGCAPTDRQAFVRHLAQVRRLFAPHLQGEQDEEWVVTLAQACWRRLRLYRAQASWEQGQLEQFFQTFLGVDGCRLSTTDSKLETGNSKSETRNSPTALHNSHLSSYSSSDNLRSSIPGPSPEQSSNHNRQSPVPSPCLSPENTLQRAYCLPDALLHRDHLEDQTRRIWSEVVRLLQDFIGSRSGHQLEFNPPPPARTAAYTRQVTRLVVAAIERHESAVGSRSSEVGENATAGEVGIDDGSSGSLGVGENAAVASTDDGRLTADDSQFESGNSKLETGNPTMDSGNSQFTIHNSQLPPQSAIRRSLEAVFLPTDRKERSFLRRVANYIDHCFARYAEEAQRDADRLSAYLTGATEGNRDSGVGSRGTSSSFSTSDSRLAAPDSNLSSQSSIDPARRDQSSIEGLLALAQSVVDVLFAKTSLRDELDEIDHAIVGLLDELVRKRSGGALYLEIHQPKDSLDAFANLLDGFFADG